MSYKKIGPEHCDYIRLRATQAEGGWMCDSVDHNESKGCSNPTCANYNKAPACDCGGEPTFHGHSQKCKKGVWLMSLGWYAETIGKLNDTFNEVFVNSTLKGAP